MKKANTKNRNNRKLSIKRRKNLTRTWLHAIGGDGSHKFGIYIMCGIIGFGAGALTISILDRKPMVNDLINAISYTPEQPSLEQMAGSVNDARLKNNQKPLIIDSRLSNIAQSRLDDMIKNQYYAHTTRDNNYYYDLFEPNGFMTKYSCENLDIGTEKAPSVYVNQWLDSTTGHKDCMLNNKVTHVGYASGIYTKEPLDSTRRPTYLVVAIFATEPYKTENNKD